MTAYGAHQTTHQTPPMFSQDVAERKAARRKVIERAQQLERNSYIAFMQKKRRLQQGRDLDTMA